MLCSRQLSGILSCWSFAALLESLIVCHRTSWNSSPLPASKTRFPNILVPPHIARYTAAGLRESHTLRVCWPSPANSDSCFMQPMNFQMQTIIQSYDC